MVGSLPLEHHTANNGLRLPLSLPRVCRVRHLVLAHNNAATQNWLGFEFHSKMATLLKTTRMLHPVQVVVLGRPATADVKEIH